MFIVYLLKDALESGLIWALLAIGVFISYRILDFADLTVEGSITLGGAISASLILTKNPFFSNPIVAIIIAFVGGMLAGALTGILHVKLKIPGILSGIISMTALYSINLLIMGKASLYIGNKTTIYDYSSNIFSNIFKIPEGQWLSFISRIVPSFLVILGLFLILYYFFGTEIGMSIRATGSNQNMSRAQGINTDIMIILGLAISNGVVAIAGALYAQSYKTANMDLGKGSIVVGLASIIIGELIFGKKTFKRWLIGIILGSVIFQIITGIALAIGFSPNNLKLLQAILIALILGLPVFKNLVFKNLRRKNHVKN